VIVHPITMLELIDLGFLVPARHFAPSIPDLKGVKIQNGEFNQHQIYERMATLTGDVVGHWVQHGENRKTLFFGVNIEHSKAVAEKFRAAGVRAEHIDADSTDAKRDFVQDQLMTGQLDVICNVGIMCTGVDIPPLACIIMGRPTQSRNLFVQQAGRGTRVFPGKKDFLLFDHAGNWTRHGYTTTELEVDLDGKIKEKFEPKPKRCLECYDVYVGSVCPNCGFQVTRSPRSSEVTVEDGELREIVPASGGGKIIEFLANMNTIARRKGYKKGWVYFQVKEEFGDETANRLFPQEAQRARFSKRA
jgi:superfamily II DNA or RNA helicase